MAPQSIPVDPRPLDWNGPGSRPFARFHDQDLERPVIEHFERVARLHHDRIAIRSSEGVLTYRELSEAVAGLAASLAARTQPSDLVGILLPASPMFPIAMLASLAAGRPFVALDPHHPPDWLDHQQREARPALVVGSEHVLPGCAPADWRPAPAGVDEAACVLFTSGSTGRPKAIVNSQRNLLQRVAQSINAAHINADDTLLTLASPSTIVGVRDTLTALLAGASIRLVDPQQLGPREIAAVIGADRTTILFAFPGLLRSLPQTSDHAAASLRLVRVGGDTTLWSDVDALRAWLPPHAAIQCVYAASEAPMMQWFVEDGCRGDDPRIPIGYPLPGNTLAIADGELVVASPYVALGRWVDGRLALEPRVFRTGDLVRLRPDGLLERLGRRDRQVKVRGSRVDLDGVESILRGHPLVRDVAVAARPGADNGVMTLVAYVSVHDSSPSPIDDLRALLRSAPAPMRPAHFHVVPSIPRLPNSKLDVRALSALDQRQAHDDRVTPIAEGTGDPVAQTVARVWQQVLLAPAPAAGDDFFDSGGDSLNAITFALELERALGFEIPLALINESPTFAGLCQVLRERRAPASSPLVTLKHGYDAPPVFFIHGVGGTVVNILPAARRMTYPGAVIGIRARGLVRGETAHRSVEAMAEDYLNAIKMRQPAGPYYLCGYSSGGLVAFEIARRLTEAGEEVGLVGLFDTRTSPVRWPLRAWRSVIGRRMGTWLGLLRSSVVRVHEWRSRLRTLRVVACGLTASARYRPGFYRGELTLFSPADRESGLPTLDSIWRSHAQSIVVVDTAGNHATMLSPHHAQAAAACLTQRLTEVPAPTC